MCAVMQSQCDMTHSYVCRDSFTLVPWRVNRWKKASRQQHWPWCGQLEAPVKCLKSQNLRKILKSQCQPKILKSRLYSDLTWKKHSLKVYYRKNEIKFLTSGLFTFKTSGELSFDNAKVNVSTKCSKVGSIVTLRWRNIPKKSALFSKKMK